MKMTSQRFCLRWNNHQSNLLSVFDQLLHAETFTDVTLAVDGHYLKAHKMVLSACSPYFNSLFLNHPEKHPIVILKDVPYSDMKSLLDFMYRGEVSVDQERLTAFLRVAESLRIKGLTEVNDDKPTGGNSNGTINGGTNSVNSNHNTEPIQTPQLQRIQPYMVQQQQQQHQQQRHKSHQPVNSINSNAASCPTMPSHTHQHHHHHQQHQQQQQVHQQQQESLLSSALLSSMPKRKRGRPRKLSGSSNGDYDEFDNDGGLADSDMGDSKMCNDSYSGNDDMSDDNQRDNDQHDEDLNESHESLSPKKSKQVKDCRNQQQQLLQQDDNSTTVHLVASSPELSQRLFGLNIKTAINNNNNSNIKTNIQSTRCTSFGAAAAATTTSSTTTNAIPHQASTNPAMITMTQHQHQQKHKQQQHQQQQFQMPTELNGKSVQATPQPPTPPSLCKSGLKVKASLQNVSGLALNSTINNSMPMIAATMATSCPMQYLTTISSPSTSVSPSTSTCTSIIPVMSMNSNSLLKQQLRSGLKDINSNVGLGLSNFGGNSNSTSNTNGNGNGVSIVTSISDDIINSTMLNAHQKINDGTIIVKATGACSALQSLANAAERQANHNNNGNNNNNNINNNGNHIQPPTANNLHHQFMLHMAANPILKSSDEEQHQQQQQEHLIIKQDINDDINVNDDANERNMDYTLHQCDDKSDPEMLTLADESAGLNYTICNNNKTNNDNNNSQQQQQQPMMTLMKTESQVVTMTVTPSISTISNDNNTNSNVNKASNVTTTATITTVAEGPIAAAATTTTTAAAAVTVTNRTKNATTKPIQRRRIRRKAQSSLEDPAEQLTEMSVRGLDLFRYASINEGVYQCTECAKENLQKTFKNKYSFQRHAFLYHEGKQRKVFPCTLCGKGFSRPDKMKNHIKMVHDVINFNSLNFLITAAATPPNERMPGPLSTPTTTRVTKKTGKSMQASSARNSVKATGKNYQLNSTRSLPSTATVPTPLPSVPAPPPQLSQPSTLQSSSTSGGNGGTVGTVGVSNASDSDAKFLIAPLTDDGTFSTNVEIKNEIIISPSPSPPPLPTLNASQYAHSSNTTMHNKTKCHLKMSMSQTSPQQAASGNTSTPLTNSAQRLAEVK